MMRQGKGYSSSSGSSSGVNQKINFFWDKAGSNKNRSRFNLLLLEYGEYLMEDLSAYYFPLPTHDLALSFEIKDSSRVQGRMKLSSRSLIFEPADVRQPMIKFPYKSMKSALEEFRLKDSEKYGLSVDITGCFTFQCSSYFEMKANNKIGPYQSIESSSLGAGDTADDKRYHRLVFALVHAAIPQFLVKVEQLRHIYDISRVQGSTTAGQLLKPFIETAQLWNLHFDTSHLINFHERLLLPQPVAVRKVRPLTINPGSLMISDSRIYFQYSQLNNTGEAVIHFEARSISHIFRRRYLLRQVALEFMLSADGSSHLFVFDSTEQRDRVFWCIVSEVSALPSIVRRQCESSSSENNGINNGHLAMLTQQWQARKISNFDYLMQLNSEADRSVNDLTQYPVFPHVLADYSSRKLKLDSPSTFRDLSKPIGALNPTRFAHFKERMMSMPVPPPPPPAASSSLGSSSTKGAGSSTGKDAHGATQTHDTGVDRDVVENALDGNGGNDDDDDDDDDSFLRTVDGLPPPFLYGTHYSTPGYVLHYLVRCAPEYMLCLQAGKFDAPDRMFHNMSSTWQSCLNNPTDLKELIPEFFVGSGEFLVNFQDLDLGFLQTGERLGDVALPPWADSPRDFIRKNAKALESEYVSEHLHEWIDLIFGYKQKGRAAREASNVFYYLTYEGAVDLDKVADPRERDALVLQIQEFGQTPKQLFSEPHLPRNMYSNQAPSRADVNTTKSHRKRDDIVESSPSTGTTGRSHTLRSAVSTSGGPSSLSSSATAPNAGRASSATSAASVVTVAAQNHSPAVAEKETDLRASVLVASTAADTTQNINLGEEGTEKEEAKVVEEEEEAIAMLRLDDDEEFQELVAAELLGLSHSSSTTNNCSITAMDVSTAVSSATTAGDKVGSSAPDAGRVGNSFGGGGGGGGGKTGGQLRVFSSTPAKATAMSSSSAHKEIMNATSRTKADSSRQFPSLFLRGDPCHLSIYPYLPVDQSCGGSGRGVGREASNGTFTYYWHSKAVTGVSAAVITLRQQQQQTSSSSTIPTPSSTSEVSVAMLASVSRDTKCQVTRVEQLVRGKSHSGDGSDADTSAATSGNLRWNIRVDDTRALPLVSQSASGSRLSCCRLLPMKNRVLFSSWDNCIYSSDLPGAARSPSLLRPPSAAKPASSPISCLYAHDDAVTCIDVDSCESMILSGSLDTTVKLWKLSDLNTGSATSTMLSYQEDEQEAEEDQEKEQDDALAGGGAFVEGGRPILEFSVGTPVLCVALHESGTVAAAGSQDGTVMAWDLRKKSVLFSYTPSSARCAILSVLVGSLTLAMGPRPPPPASPPRGAGSSVAGSVRNGTQEEASESAVRVVCSIEGGEASSSSSSKLVCLDTRGKVIASWPVSHSCHSLECDGRVVYGGCSDGSIRAWLPVCVGRDSVPSPDSGTSILMREVLSHDAGHRGPIYALSLAPLTPPTGRLTAGISTGNIHAGDFVADECSALLVSGGEDCSIKIWRLYCADPVGT